MAKIAKIEPRDTSESGLKYYCWGILLLLILFVSFIRIRLISIPLERDEGEFAYMGQLILQGIPPYLISYNMKLPGIYAAYALMMFVFGESAEGIHLGFLIINAATVALVFLLGRHLYDSYTGLIASASFAILSVSPSVLGTSAHATHFVLLPALGGIIIMLKATQSGKFKHLFWSGILLGISFLMKQPGIFFAIFAFCYFLFSLYRIRNIPYSLIFRQGLLFLFGAIVPFALTIGILYKAGVLEKFWFWTYLYGKEYASRVPFSMGPQIFLSQVPHIVGQFYLLWVIGGVGISAFLWDKTARTRAPFVLGFFVFSFLAVCPGLYFREHYFVLILPAVALLIGIGINSLRRLISRFQPKFRWVSTILFLVFLSVGVYSYGPFFFEIEPVQACRMTYGPNPFPESVRIAEYIKARSKKEDKIAILGSEPQIYFYSNRHSATGYIYVYGLMENQKYALRMQLEMASEIEKVEPKYLVFVNIPTSWLANVGSERYILEWLREYLKKKFSLVGVVDILSSERTEYRWDSEAANYAPRSPYFLYVYKNNTTGG
jgi:4-amino-4-deoxy-L-arabinose transferase-like glycosyltransferase